MAPAPAGLLTLKSRPKGPRSLGLGFRANGAEGGTSIPERDGGTGAVWAPSRMLT